MVDLPLNYQRLEASLASPSKYRDVWHERYHQEQADPCRDTAAKKLARDAGHKSVRCPCGESFPARVQ